MLSCALRRLTSICRIEVIGLPASNWVRFVIWTAGRGIVRSEPGTIQSSPQARPRRSPGFQIHVFSSKRGSDAKRLYSVATPPMLDNAALRRDYNHVRPHSRIGWLALAVYAANFSPQSRPRRCVPQWLRALAPCSNCAKWQLPDSQRTWIRAGGNVTDFRGA